MIDAVARQVFAAAKREIRPGISPAEALVIGCSKVVSPPTLNPYCPDDAAIILRASRLILEGVLVSQAVATAREEQATWVTPEAAHAHYAGDDA